MGISTPVWDTSFNQVTSISCCPGRCLWELNGPFCYVIHLCRDMCNAYNDILTVEWLYQFVILRVFRLAFDIVAMLYPHMCF
jgi:hypothetical protein